MIIICLVSEWISVFEQISFVNESMTAYNCSIPDWNSVFEQNSWVIESVTHLTNWFVLEYISVFKLISYKNSHLSPPTGVMM